MRALCWHGKGDVRVDTVPDPKIQHPRDVDPSFVVTHPARLEDAPEMYRKFREKESGVIKVVMRPGL